MAIAILPLKVLAIDSNFKNSLDEIYIKKTSGNTFSVNFLFNKEYTEPLSLQKKGANTYSIILPETKLTNKNIKIDYKDAADSVKLSINEFPYIDQSINNGYVKITATVKNNAKINVSTDIISGQKKITKTLPKSKTKESTIEKTITEKQKTETTLPQVSEIEKNTTTKTTTPSKEDLEIMSGMSSVNEIIEDPPIQEQKSGINRDYLDVMIKISLFLFIIMLLARKFYKKSKIKVERAVEREELKQNYRKRLDGINEDTNKTNAQTNSQHATSQKSPFQKQIESMTTQEIQPTISTKEHEEINQDVYSKIPTLHTEEDEYLDENYDYEIIEAPEEVDKTNTPTLLSEAKIDSNKGFYLIKYAGEIALMGYIKDEYFVINRFNKIFKPNLQARLHERLDHCTNYLLRVDGYKALIQVTENDMKVLIEFY